jgi:hypothetical protein
MRRTGPLAIDYLMEIVGRSNVGRFHSFLTQTSLQAEGAQRPPNDVSAGFFWILYLE